MDIYGNNYKLLNNNSYSGNIIIFNMLDTKLIRFDRNKSNNLKRIKKILDDDVLLKKLSYNKK